MKPLAASDSNGVPSQQDKTPVSIQLTRVVSIILLAPLPPPPSFMTPRDMITGSVMDVHRISIGAPSEMNERRRSGQGRGGRGLTIAPSSLRCVSVCCTRNGRHVLAVTRARRQTHAHVNNKDSVDVIGLVRDRFMK